jgi:16S rRNA (cytosine967-C5)-methyltransferase
VPECLVLEDGTANPAALAGFAEGLITAEDEGAQAAALLAGPDSDARLVLDLCAAPGGKTAHMADRLAPEARQIATDVSQKKLDRMQNTLERLGLTRRVNTGLAPEVLRDVEPETFDHVLVDAPCSGLGTLRRHPEARYRRSPESIRGNAQDQVRLLRSVVPLVRTGGTIGYSVCTWTREEGEDAAARFLEAEPRFERAEAPEDAPGLAEKCATGNGYWRTWTHRHGCDAFFVARFRRRE